MDLQRQHARNVGHLGRVYAGFRCPCGVGGHDVCVSWQARI